MTDKDLIIQLHNIGAIQFGEFELKSGITSPFYLDLRKVVSYPQVFKAICIKIWTSIKNHEFNHICGVPYAAASFASGISVLFNKATLTKRKERKSYGNKKMIEGVYKNGDTVLVIEDIVTSGASMLETLADMKQAHLKVSQTIAIIDRQQGGMEVIKNKGYEIFALYTIEEVMEILINEDILDASIKSKVIDFIKNNQIKPANKTDKLAYKDRADHADHPITKRLLNTINDKQTNLIFSADLAEKEEMMQMADLVGPYICALKTHTDFYQSFSPADITQLKSIAEKHNFLLFEDRKYADIGSTVQKQFISKNYDVPNWADMVTVHLIGGASTVDALEKTKLTDSTALIAIVEMSTNDTLTDTNYVRKAKAIVKKHPSVIGAVVQRDLELGPNKLQFTPGINLNTQGDGLGQSYNNPTTAFKKRGTDVMIVGRGIYQADDPVASAIAYKNAGWNAFQSYLNDEEE